MNDLNKAYEIINSIPLDANRDLVFSMATEAFEESPLCFEAASIISHIVDNYEDKEKILLTNINSLTDVINNQIMEDTKLINNLNKAKYELGSLYYEYGFYKQSLKLFETLDIKINELIKYKLMVIYTLLEDERIENLYKTLITEIDNIEYVRLSFTYLIYLYKTNQLYKARELFKEIDKINPNIKLVLNDEEVDDELTKEAYKVLKNNSILINSCPYLIKDIVLYN